MVNNVRFLILPWVQVEHLASKVLAANIRRLAANWRYVGATQGTAKRGNRHYRHGQCKAVFFYPLCRDFREQSFIGLCPTHKS